jgi:hypothetical protein
MPDFREYLRALDSMGWKICVFIAPNAHDKLGVDVSDWARPLPASSQIDLHLGNRQHCTSVNNSTFVKHWC